MGVDLMKFDEIQEEIQRYSKAAGAGNFDRTAFEYSPEMSCLQDIQDKYKSGILTSKFVVPEDGIYQYKFDYKAPYVDKLYVFQDIYSYPRTIADTSSLDKYYNYKNRNIGERVYEPNKGFQNQFTISYLITGSNSGYSNVSVYFHASKGTPIALSFVTQNSVSLFEDKKLILSIRNQKITY